MAKRKKSMVLLPPAKRDIKKGYDWYEEQRHAMGDVFLERVEECLASIRRNPKAFQLVAKDARRAVVKQFPYVVFFKTEDKVIYVYAVFHTSQDPQKWMDRLDD
ncbi:MAG TPA: type II toxin-antitoxin system RelE/ParE family toxin [Planctomycetaceae bacterium]|nr:type II toxin-antitoxin system RelE/ParE family toxin [Planctomycetaceae bacterium]